MEETRKPWLAGLLSFVCPGLGHIYAGDLRTGLWLVIILSPAGYFFYVISVYNLKLKTALLVLIGVALITQIAIILHAVRLARKNRINYTLKNFNRGYVYIGVVLIVSFIYQPIISSLVKNYYIQAYRMPAGSMMPTLIVGDHFIVDKSIYRSESPKRVDVAVFRYPLDKSIDYIKRVIGLPGDEIFLKGNKLYINGEEQVEDYAMYSNSEVERNKDFGPFVVPEATIFFLGDNRDNSNDSRIFGPVAIKDVKGKAIGIYWSMTTGIYWSMSEDKGILMERFGKEIK